MNHDAPSPTLVLAAKAARAADQVLTVLTYIALTLVIVYASYVMWDNYQILNGARAVEPPAAYKGGGFLLLRYSLTAKTCL